jgi:CelD/BcsL family acetyltransferase involved in cellulose biosynthesis
LGSPFFAPEFTTSIGSVRENARVAIIEENEKIQAFFPFELGKYRIGIPIGGTLSDYHGLVGTKDHLVNTRDLLRGCGLVAWRFSHLPLSQLSFRESCRYETTSPVVDLSGGYDSYIEGRRRAGTKVIAKCGNLARQLERTSGPLRFIEHSADSSLLQILVRWKSEQYLRTGERDIFAMNWTRQLLEGIQQVQTGDFAGRFSLLYSGERLVAAHFGMRSGNVWHYWFPAYDPEFAKYSPGLLLLLRMIERASFSGVTILDLGLGGSPYKQRFMNCSIPLGSGAVERLSAVTIVQTASRILKDAVRNSRFADPARRLYKLVNLKRVFFVQP